MNQTFWNPRVLRALLSVMAVLSLLTGSPGVAAASEESASGDNASSVSPAVLADDPSAMEEDASEEPDAATTELEEEQEDSDAEPSDDGLAKEEDASQEGLRPSYPVSMTVRVAGSDGEWASVGIELPEGSSAWDATELALDQLGFWYRTGAASQDTLASVTRVQDGLTCASDSSTGNGWHLYLNGARYQGLASTLVPSDGDEISWCYEVATYVVSVSVVGPGGTGTSYWIPPTNVRVASTQSGWDASRMVFEQNGYGEGRLLSYATAKDGSTELESLAGLGENGITGESWQVFINGMAPQADIAHITLSAGDSICWYYAGRGTTELPRFALRTGAASQNPATAVRVEGTVSQAWSVPTTAPCQLPASLLVVEAAKPEDDTIQREGAALPAVLDVGSALETTPGLGANAQSAAMPSYPLRQTASYGWSRSLARILNDKLRTGTGGRATLAADGSLFYLDNVGTVVKLEVR